MPDPSEMREDEGFLATFTAPSGRRAFLRASGVAVGVLTLPACDDILGDDDDDDGGRNGVVIDFAAGDTAVLNFAYALEQLEAAYYTRVTSSFYAGVTAEERSILEDLRDHEVAHRELFRAALKTDAIGSLEPNFSAVDFTNRASVLNTAQTFEDLGVWAYNGAGKFLKSEAFLTVAGKIVSVEARHAAAIRQLREPAQSLFSVVDPMGLDKALLPGAVVEAAAPFIRTRITLRNAPTA